MIQGTNRATEDSRTGVITRVPHWELTGDKVDVKCGDWQKMKSPIQFN